MLNQTVASILVEGSLVFLGLKILRNLVSKWLSLASTEHKELALFDKKSRADNPAGLYDEIQTFAKIGRS